MNHIKTFFILVLCILISACESLNFDFSLPEFQVEEDNEECQLKLIDDEHLNGWDDGVFNDSAYILFKKNDLNQTVVLFDVFEAEDDYQGISMIIDDAGELVEYSVGQMIYDVYPIDGGYIVSWVNDAGEFEDEFIECAEPSESSPTTKSSMATKSVLDDVLKAVEKKGDIDNSITVASDIHNADYKKLAKDLAGMAIDKLVTILLAGCPPLLAVYEYGKFMTDYLDNQQSKKLRAAFYSDCYAEITDISNNANGEIDVLVSIHNAGTIPSHLGHLYYREPEEVTRNSVYCGVVGRAGLEPTTHLYTSPYQSEHLIDASSNSDFIIQVFRFPMPSGNITYTFKPYLKSTRLIKNGDVAEKYIKYGNARDYTAFDGYISELSTVEIDYAHESNSFFTENIVSASITPSDKVEDWGIYVLDENGNYERYSSGFSSRAMFSDDIRLAKEIKKEDFTIYPDFLATSEISVGVYVKQKNPQGVYDYATYYYSELQTFYVDYDVKPSLQFTRVNVLGTSVDYTEVDDDGNTIVHYITSCECTYEITGTFWISTIQWCIDGGKWITHATAEDVDFDDGTYSRSWNKTYTNSFSGHTNYYVLSLTDGTSSSSNSLVFSGSGTSVSASISGGATYSPAKICRHGDNLAPKQMQSLDMNDIDCD